MPIAWKTAPGRAAVLDVLRAARPIISIFRTHEFIKWGTTSDAVARSDRLLAAIDALLRGEGECT